MLLSGVSLVFCHLIILSGFCLCSKISGISFTSQLSVWGKVWERERCEKDEKISDTLP